MNVEIPDDEVRQFLQLGRREKIGPALLDWLYKDPRFEGNRQHLLGEWLVRRLVARALAGEALEDDAEQRRIG